MTHSERKPAESGASQRHTAEELHAEQVFYDLRKRVAANQKRFHAKAPKKASGVIARLMQTRGYAQIRTTGVRDDAWLQAVGPELGSVTQVMGIRRGVFEVQVANSLVTQELTFRKESLLMDLQKALPDAGIKQLRFRVGQLEAPPNYQ